MEFYWRDVGLLLLTWLALCILLTLMPDCAHPPRFIGPMCTEDPMVNDKKADACLDMGELRMCAWSEGTYLVRQGCYADWVEVPDDTSHVLP